MQQKKRKYKWQITVEKIKQKKITSKINLRRGVSSTQWKESIFIIDPNSKKIEN
jgi:hypothetical protein